MGLIGGVIDIKGERQESPNPKTERERENAQGNIYSHLFGHRFQVPGVVCWEWRGVEGMAV